MFLPLIQKSDIFEFVVARFGKSFLEGKQVYFDVTLLNRLLEVIMVLVKVEPSHTKVGLFDKKELSQVVFHSYSAAELLEACEILQETPHAVVRVFATNLNDDKHPSYFKDPVLQFSNFYVHVFGNAVPTKEKKKKKK